MYYSIMEGVIMDYLILKMDFPNISIMSTTPQPCYNRTTESE